MFAYLAAQKGRAVPRHELAEVLWGDEPPATWDKALRVLMTKLRALLEECGIDGSTALTSAFGCYKLTLPEGAWIDVDAAEEAVELAETALTAGDLAEARSQATQAAALARRSFLPGEDGIWVEERRRELRELLVRALECLRDAAFGAKEFAESVRHAEEVIELEPFRESAYRRLMQAHAAGGNPAEALRVYERCRRFLADELGAYPSPETEAAYVEILRSKRAGARPVPAGDVGAPARRHARAAVLVGALVIAAAAAAGAFLLVREEGAGASLVDIDGNAVAALDAGSGATRHAVEVPMAPTAIAAGHGYIWAASADSNTVVVLDPKTNTVRDTIPVESAPGGIAIGGAWAWVTNSLTGSVSQISPQTLSVVQTIRVGNGPTGIAAGNGHVWVTNTSDHTVSKLRASDGKRVATFAAGPDPGAVAVGEGAIWVASKLSAVLAQAQPGNRRGPRPHSRRRGTRCDQHRRGLGVGCEQSLGDGLEGGPPHGRRARNRRGRAECRRGGHCARTRLGCQRAGGYGLTHRRARRARDDDSDGRSSDGTRRTGRHRLRRAPSKRRGARGRHAQSRLPRIGRRRRSTRQAPTPRRPGRRSS